MDKSKLLSNRVIMKSQPTNVVPQMWGNMTGTEPNTCHIMIVFFKWILQSFTESQAYSSVVIINPSLIRTTADKSNTNYLNLLVYLKKYLKDGLFIKLGWCNREITILNWWHIIRAVIFAAHKNTEVQPVVWTTARGQRLFEFCCQWSSGF